MVIAVVMNQGGEKQAPISGGKTAALSASTVFLMPESISTPNEPEVYDFAYG